MVICMHKMTKKLVKMQMKYVKKDCHEGRENRFGQTYTQHFVEENGMTKYEKGYGIKAISKGMVKKAAFGEAIKAVTDTSALQEKMQKALNAKGKVYGLYHKRQPEMT